MAAAAYYTSFASVGIVIYLIRTRQGYRSLPEAINERYGSLATLAFGLAVLFRLYQEVWSDALVVGGFYGDEVISLKSIRCAYFGIGKTDHWHLVWLCCSACTNKPSQTLLLWLPPMEMR